VRVVRWPGFPTCCTHVEAVDIAAMCVAVVLILPTFVGSWRTQGLRCSSPAKTIPGWLLVAAAGTAATLTSAIASAYAVVGHALVLCGGIDVAWGLLANGYAELLDICQLALHRGQAGCLAFDGFSRGHVHGAKVCQCLLVWHEGHIVVNCSHTVAML
jgi:hypothetical protein